MRYNLLEDGDYSKYVKAFFDEDLNLFEMTWTEKSEDMEDEEYKDIMLNMLAQLKKLVDGGMAYKYALIDHREDKFSMSPDLQEWQTENIFGPMMELVNVATQKTALIMTDDFIAALSHEQTIEENPDVESQTQFFTDERDAREWLLGASDQGSTSGSTVRNSVDDEESTTIHLEDNEYFKADYDLDDKYFELVCYKEITNIVADQYEVFIQAAVDKLDHKPITAIFIDSRDITLTNTHEELQAWLKTNIQDRLFSVEPDAPTAILVSEDFMDQNKVDEVNVNATNNTRYFVDEIDVKLWLAESA